VTGEHDRPSSGPLSRLRGEPGCAADVGDGSGQPDTVIGGPVGGCHGRYSASGEAHGQRPEPAGVCGQPATTWHEHYHRALRLDGHLRKVDVGGQVWEVDDAAVGRTRPLLDRGTPEREGEAAGQPESWQQALARRGHG
jgi:hypothetical protein